MPDTAGLAIDLAMEEARNDPSLRAAAAAFLHNQNTLVDLQKHHLHVQLLPALWEKWLGVLLRVATACVGLGVAGMLCFLVWDAAHSWGLILEPFSVPADMAGRGLNGQVVASQVIDKLTSMMARESSRAAMSYASNTGDTIKVEIPETGISIGELRNFLREWLGHDTRISGEVFRTASGITVTARVSGGDAGASFTGSEADLDSLLQKAAEHVYEVTQPYRYANYLDRAYSAPDILDRAARATVIYRRLIAGNDPVERAWAWNGLGTIASAIHHDTVLGRKYYYRSIAAAPDVAIGYFALSTNGGLPGTEEETLALARQADRLLAREPVPDFNPHYTTSARLTAKEIIAWRTGDYGVGADFMKKAADLPDDFAKLSRNNFISNAARGMFYQHDPGGARAWLRDLGVAAPPQYSLFAGWLVSEDWQHLAAFEKQLAAQIAQTGDPDTRRSGENVYNSLRYILALARAKLGDFAGAEAIIAPMTPEQDTGLRTRGQIAEMQGQHERADWWFARAVAHEPSIPFAAEAWGRALLARGQPDAALPQFTASNRIGPHFADALEGWGEALMAKNQSHLALGKFEEADKYAPNWGRLHLKWGEALVYAGKKAEAKAQFARAAQLDLTPSEKGELAGANHV